jgi:hypothetical protein
MCIRTSFVIGICTRRTTRAQSETRAAQGQGQEGTMKKLLLSGIAALSVLSASAAQTFATKTELPTEMLGSWCGMWGWQFPDDGAMRWWRTEDYVERIVETVAASVCVRTVTTTIDLDRRVLVSLLQLSFAARANPQTI